MMDVIVVNLNRPKETKKTIDCLLEANDNINIILVNNGSLKKAKHKSKKVKTINLHRNLGQAGGVNMGLKQATSEYVCFMHNDIFIKDKNWIAKAVEFLKSNPEAGLVDIYGWKWIDGRLRHFTSLKGHSRNRPVEPTEEFTEVVRTDEMANIFKNDGLRADVRYRRTCCGVWIDVLGRGKKLYVIKLENGVHSKNSEVNPSYWKFNRKEVRLQKLKEQGLADSLHNNL